MESKNNISIEKRKLFTHVGCLILVLFASVALLLILAPHTAVGATSGDYDYQVMANNEAQITGYHGSGGDVIIPSLIDGFHVTSIRDHVFTYNELVTSVFIPGSVKMIGAGTFGGCENLRSLTLSEGVETLGPSSFGGTNQLSVVNIPSSVILIDDNAFGSINTKAFNVAATNANYISVDGVIYNKAMTTVVLYPGGKEVAEFTIPNSVTNIGDFSFCQNVYLTSIIIPGGVTTLPIFSFGNCYALTQMIFEGNAPTTFGENWDYQHTAALTVYFFSGATGFTTPMWEGLPCVCILPDNTPPAISVYGPTGQIKSVTDVPYIGAMFSDSGSGIDTSSVKVLINGVDCSSNAIITSSGVQYPTAKLPVGPGSKEVPKGQYTIVVLVSDKTGNTASVSWNIQLTGSAYKK